MTTDEPATTTGEAANGGRRGSKAESDDALPYRAQLTRKFSDQNGRTPPHQVLSSAPESPGVAERGGADTITNQTDSSTYSGFIPDPNQETLFGIEDNTPAAAALRATAQIQVRRAAKLARKIHVQQLRKLVKKATLRGNKRGKPPRIPPTSIVGSENNDGEANKLFQVDEQDEEEEEDSDASDDEEEKLEENDISRGRQTLGLTDTDSKVPAEVLTATMRTGKQILAANDPHDILSNQRWRKRRRRGSNIDVRKSYVKGKVIDGEHELYALSIAVMLGVRTSIGTTNIRMKTEQKKWLSSDDFMAVDKYQFKPSGSPTTPPHQLGHTFKFKDYSPLAFAYLRRLFGVNEFDFLLSVCGNANFIEFISNAKSGQFFFYSNDGKYMIKTMTNSESKFLRRILPHYFRHCSQNPNTLMTKFLGMYRVKLYHLRRNVKFVIMNSVYHTDKYLQQFYDLKGSITGRDAKAHHDVKKDNDLRGLLPDGGALVLDPVTRTRLRKQVVADCEFMRKMKIMDYSMLVGIHHIPSANGKVNDEKDVGPTGFRFSNRRESMRFRDYLRSSMRSNLTADGGGNSGSSLPGRQYESDRQLMSFSSSMPNKLTSTSDDTASIESRGTSLRPTLDQMSDDMRDSEKQFAQLAVYDYALDDDDDNSYLEGSDTNPTKPPATNADESLEVKKLHTIQQVYWPFHRLYDINGHRRLIRGPVDEEREAEELQTMADSATKVAEHTPPVSDRKDGGLMMDISSYEMPLSFKTKAGREHLCEGKIFYMGVIDILQQYNMRKRVEARYRRIQGSGWRDASCVHPDVYAERFVQFFDEYTQRLGAYDLTLEDGEEGIIFQQEETKEEVEPSIEVSEAESRTDK